MPYTFFIPKEHRRATGGEVQITVPDQYHGDASKTMSDQFGFPLDMVEGWSASPTSQGTPINVAIQKLQPSTNVFGKSLVGQVANTFGQGVANWGKNLFSANDSVESPNYYPQYPGTGGVPVQPKDSLFLLGGGAEVRPQEFSMDQTGTVNDPRFFPEAKSLASARARLDASRNFDPDFSSGILGPAGNLAGQVEPFDIARKAEIEADVAEAVELQDAGKAQLAQTMWEKVVAKYGSELDGWMNEPSTFPTEKPGPAGLTGSAGFADDMGYNDEYGYVQDNFVFEPTGNLLHQYDDPYVLGEERTPSGIYKDAWTPNKRDTNDWEDMRDRETNSNARLGDKGPSGEGDSGVKTTNQVLAMFPKTGGTFGPATFSHNGIEQINPLLAELLTAADLQGGNVSAENVANAYAASAEAVAAYNKDADIAGWAAQGASNKEIAELELANTNVREDQRIAAEEYVADQQLQASLYAANAQTNVAISQRKGVTAAAESSRRGQEAAARSQAAAIKDAAKSQAGATKDAATSAAGGVTGAAESARLGQEAAAASQAGAIEAAAKTAAGAASPFGFLQQGGTEADLSSVYAQLNEVGLAEAGARESQAAAANLAARGNAFGFAAGQETFNPNQVAQIAANTDAGLTGRAQVEASQIQANAQQSIAQIQASVGIDQTQKEYLIAQIIDQTQRAVAAIQGGAQRGVATTQAGGQIGAAQAGASGFGALLTGNAGVNKQANEILRAQAANNPYAIQQLGRGWSDTAAGDQNLRIDQILRGGLSPEQRIAEINASQSGQNFANQLNFMGNPSAVGFATEQGMFKPNGNFLEDINNSPEGMIPGSTFGFNSPTAAGAGGNATTNTGNFNANTLRNASDEQVGFLQGAASAGGQSPSEFNQQVESFTPQGVY